MASCRGRVEQMIAPCSTAISTLARAPAADPLQVQRSEISYAGPSRHREMGHVFLNLNRNKRSLVLDLKHPDAAPVMLALTHRSDVLMHNMRPQAMARLGFGWERLREVNPRL